MQSRFDKYSVNNAILILAQNENATSLKTASDWIKAGARVKGNSILILEPVEYTKEDGTQATTYNAKKVLDISQTNLKTNEKKSKYDDRIMLNAFLNACSFDLKGTEDLGDNETVKWDKENNVLYIKKGMDSSLLFNSLAKEIAKADFEDTNPKINDFKSKCISYMICNKYNIDVSDYKITEIPEELKSMNQIEFKNSLTQIKEAMQDMNSRMGVYFETLAKDKNKEQVR